MQQRLCQRGFRAEFLAPHPLVTFSQALDLTIMWCYDDWCLARWFESESSVLQLISLYRRQRACAITPFEDLVRYPPMFYSVACEANMSGTPRDSQSEHYLCRSDWLMLLCTLCSHSRCQSPSALYLLFSLPLSVSLCSVPSVLTLAVSLPLLCTFCSHSRCQSPSALYPLSSLSLSVSLCSVPSVLTPAVSLPLLCNRPDITAPVDWA